MTTAKQVHMEMKNALTRIRAGVDHQAVAALVNALLAGKLFGNQGHAPEQVGVLFFKVIDRDNMLIGDNKEMHRRCRVQIPKGGYPFIAENDPAIRLSANDTAENAIGLH